MTSSDLRYTNLGPTKLKAPGGVECDLMMSFKDIASIVLNDEGQPYSRQQINNIHDRAFRKLRDALLKDPVIREYLKENGITDEI